MRPISLVAITVVLSVAVVTDGRAQTEKMAAAPTQSAVGQAPVQIISHKIGVDYYPMLDRPSTTAPAMTADTGDIPMTENERLSRQRNRNNKWAAAPVAPDDTRTRGRLRSYTRVIDNAEQIQVVLKNSEHKAIQSVDWDFAYPRYENGRLLSRYDVTTKVEIKADGKKTLKYKLPAGAKRCEVVKVINDESQQKVSTFEAVCGAGFNDPSLLDQKQETISIKRITYTDGSVWQRKE